MTLCVVCIYQHPEIDINTTAIDDLVKDTELREAVTSLKGHDLCGEHAKEALNNLNILNVLGLKG